MPLVRFPAAEGMGIVTCGDTGLCALLPAALDSPLFLRDLILPVTPTVGLPGDRWDEVETWHLRVPHHQGVKVACPEKVPVTSWRPVFADYQAPEMLLHPGMGCCTWHLLSD